MMEEKRKIQSPPSPIAQDHPILLDIEEEEVWIEPIVEGASDEFLVSNFDFMPVGTYLE